MSLYQVLEKELETVKLSDMSVKNSTFVLYNMEFTGTQVKISGKEAQITASEASKLYKLLETKYSFDNNRGLSIL